MPPKSLQEKSNCRIYAAGCNAWNNLSFSPRNVDEGTQQGQLGDIHRFTVVEESNKVEDLKAYLTWTAACIDGQRRVAGAAPGEELQTQLIHSTQNGKGELLDAFDNSSKIRSSESHVAPAGAPKASEGFVDFNPRTAAAWQTGFVMMDEGGRVFTLGDKRYAACLGRSVTADQPAERPHIVEDLPDPTDKICKVVAGGYTVGALTEEGHLYAWGMQTPGHAASEKQAIAGLSAVPNYQSIPEEGEDEDVADASFGDYHALALTKEGKVYVIGSNKNGQLGLGWDRKHRAECWEKVDLDLGEYRVKEVVAGPQTSFLIARLP